MLRMAVLQVAASHKRAITCEDAATPDPGSRGYSSPKRARLDTSTPLRLAVADGASTSSHAREWSRLLTLAIAQGTLTHASVREQLPLVQAKWRSACAAAPSKVARLFRGRSDTLPPSLSTLAVLELSAASDRPSAASWKFWGIGDSGVLWFRADHRRATFPYTSPDQFTRSPMLLSSVSTSNGISPDDFAVAEGVAMEGDVVLLATDEVYRHLLRLDPAAAGRWLDAVWHRPSMLVRSIRSMRQTGEMDDDDVTVVVGRIIRPGV